MSDKKSFYVKVAPVESFSAEEQKGYELKLETLLKGDGKVSVKYDTKSGLLTLKVSRTTQYDIHHELIIMAGKALKGNRHTKFQTNAPVIN